MSGAVNEAVGTGVGADLRAAGERIEALLVASSAHGAMARERSEELVRLVAASTETFAPRELADLLAELSRGPWTGPPRFVG